MVLHLNVCAGPLPQSEYQTPAETKTWAVSRGKDKQGGEKTKGLKPSMEETGVYQTLYFCTGVELKFFKRCSSCWKSKY